MVADVAADPAQAIGNSALLGALADAWANGSWAASPDYLSEAMSRAYRGRGPILECGSGLSTILVAAVTRGTGRPVLSLENSDVWARRVSAELAACGFSHAQVALSPLRSVNGYDWYDAVGSLPKAITLVLCDGPPGTTRGGRSGLVPECWDCLAPDVVILLDDAARAGEVAIVGSWTRDYPLAVRLVESGRNPYAILERSSRT
jgi:predicted O-methyltransferase YrrM